MGEEKFIQERKMIALVTNNDDLKLNNIIEEIKIVKIPDPADLHVELIEPYEGVIVDARNIRYALEFLTKIRSSITSVKLYLKPVFLYSDSSIADKYLMEISDGQVDSRNIVDVLPITKRILEKIRNFQNFQGNRLDYLIALKTLQFMVSRNVDLNPVVMPKSKFGYVYPLITVNFPERDDARMFEIIDFIEKRNLADSRFVDRIHLCPDCYSSFINFRETCPKCGSSNLSVDDLIHHFSCGYVGPESKFKVEDKLICPKCGKTLKHIGMDYDKPSIIYTCKDCNYNFQEPEITGFCFYCGTSSPVDNLIKRDIKSFRVSQVTINCAINGIILSLRDIIASTMKVYSNYVFKAILDHEYKKQKRYNTQSVLVYLRFNFESKDTQFKQNQQEIIVEIARVMKETLRDSDAITAIDDVTFAILLLEATSAQAKIIMSRLKREIEKFIKSNFPQRELNIEIQYLSLKEALNADFFNSLKYNE